MAYSSSGETDLPTGSILREFCEVCGAKFVHSEWEYATHKGKRVRVCCNCKRAIELREQ